MPAPALILLIATLATGDVPRIVFRDRVEVMSPRVRLADVADLSVLPVELAARVGGLELLRLPSGQREMAVPGGRLAERVGTIAPALKPLLQVSNRTVTVALVEVTPPADPADRPCATVLEPIAAGETPRTSALVLVSCVAPSSAAFRYDPASGLVRSRRALGVGDLAPAPPPNTLATVRAGDRIALRAQVGPVLVEHTVQALRTAPAGGPLTVRTAEGRVLTVPATEGLR